MFHHTKTKGDNGVAHAISDLSDRGYTVLLPITEHAPFDLVAYRGRTFKRVQVKYKCLKRGVLDIDLRSVWSNSKGSYHKVLDKTAVDIVCVYCPDTSECYYFNPRKVGGAYFRIRPGEFVQMHL